MGEPGNKKSKNLTELEEFDAVFPDLLKDLENYRSNAPEIKDAIEWFKQVSQYNVPYGKKNRGISAAESYRHFVNKTDLTEQNLRKARILGWCVEWLQAMFLVADDMMDHSIIRRGQPCWYKQNHVGLIAINDSFFLESAIYVILKKHFRQESYYVHLLDLFHEITMNTVTGQMLDLSTPPAEGTDFTRYTEERFLAIVKWKTAYYSFYLPVALAMHMAGISDEESHLNAKTILLHLGTYFQSQDDYLDCFAEPEVLGKIGTDIETNKCGWLAIEALKRVNVEQRQVMEDNYGVFDAAKVAKIKDLYRELGLPEVFKEFEENSYADYLKLVDKCHGSLPKEVFEAFGRRIYKRKY